MVYPYFVQETKFGDHKCWVADSASLEGCIGQGETWREAVAELEENERIWLETAKEMGFPIPPIPIKEEV